MRALPLLLALWVALAGAETIALKPGHPDRYRVQPGDTLWSIAGRFLQDPWRWKEVWKANPEIADPDLIYPGDVIELHLVDGRPVLSRQAGPREVRLTPRVRRESLARAVPEIPLDAIRQFLSRPRVLPKSELDRAPYLVAFVEEHILGGAGDTIYARSIVDALDPGFDLVRPGKAYRDPDTGAVLGYEALFVADAQLVRPGDPAKLLLTHTTMEAEIGDRLFPHVDDEVLDNFHPRPAPEDVDGAIVAVINGVSQIGQYNVVVLSRGGDAGLSVGDVLDVYGRGERVRDPFQAGLLGGRVRLPEEFVGRAMVFRLYPQVSYALVLDATRTIHIHDRVRSPLAE